MNKKTAKALEESIAHWKRMRDDIECKDEPYAEACPLCSEFAGIARYACPGCPVDASGDVKCKTGPWEDAADAWEDYDDGRDDEHWRNIWIKESNKEIAFLESLRE